VHESLVSAWITPTTMTIREGEPAKRCSLLAEFNNGLVGDITNHPGITWSVTGANITLPSALHGKFTATYDAGVPGNNSRALAASINANSLLNSTGTAISATGSTIKVKATWTAPTAGTDTRPRAKWIIGKGEAFIDEVPNYLFIVDGAKSTDQPNAELLVKDLYKKMADNKKSPWNHLRDSVNFWLLFVPSEDAAVTIRNEITKVLGWEQRRSHKKLSAQPASLAPVYTSPGIDQEQEKYYYNDNPANLAAGKWWEVATVETKKTGWRSVNEFIVGAEEFMQNPTLSFFAFWDLIIADPTKNVGDPARYSTGTFTLGAHDLSITEMLDKVGFPTPKDAASGVTLSTLVTNKFRVLFDPTINGTGATDPKIIAQVFKIWKILAERRLPNEMDSAFGVGFGVRPRADKSFKELAIPERMPLYYRLNRNYLEYLLTNIRTSSTDVNKKTNHWIDSVHAPTDAAWATNFADLGKDFGNIVIISTRTRSGGVQVHHYDASGNFIGQGIFVNQEDDPFCYPSVAGRQVNLLEHGVVSTFNITTYGTVTHEITHSMELGDEYSEKTTQLDPANPPNGLLLPPITGLNLVAEKAVLTNPAQENAGLIDGNKIKWRWPRIENAGVLSIAPSGSGPYTITLKTGNGTGFKNGDEVYLRKKGLKPVVHLNQVDTPQYSSKLTITLVAGDVITATGAITIGSWGKDDVLVRLVKANVEGKGTISVSGTTVTGVGTYFDVQVNPIGGAGNSQITVKVGANFETRTVTSVGSNTSLQIASAFSATVPAGTKYTILQRDIGLTHTDSYKELLNYTVRMTINKNKKPMTKYPYVADANDGGEPQDVEVGQLKVDATDNVYKLISGSGIQPRNIVGLFKNGRTYTHGVFHPTGFCHMRNNLDSEIIVPKVVNNVKVAVSATMGTTVPTMTLYLTDRRYSGYCAVCRYVMVDKLNPKMHDKINSDATSYYPKI
jgi:hypothetical protein